MPNLTIVPSGTIDEGQSRFQGSLEVYDGRRRENGERIVVVWETLTYSGQPSRPDPHTHTHLGALTPQALTPLIALSYFVCSGSPYPPFL